MSCFLVGAFGYVLYLIFRNHKLQKFNHHVADELDIIFRSVYDRVHVAQEKTAVKRKSKLFKNDPENVDLDDPGMLSTLITVIVNKHGSMRLELADFQAVDNDEYVSVYVDTKTSELLLSVDHAMEKKAPVTMVNFSDPDDGTFH